MVIGAEDTGDVAAGARVKGVVVAGATDTGPVAIGADEAGPVLTEEADTEPVVVVGPAPTGEVVITGSTGEVVTGTSTNTGVAVDGVAVLGAEDTGPVVGGPDESTAEEASNGIRTTGAGVGGVAGDRERSFKIGWEVRSARLTQG